MPRVSTAPTFLKPFVILALTWLAALVLALPPSSAFADIDGSPSPTSSGIATADHIEVELISERRRIAPGEPFSVALRLLPEHGWHTYWRNPGDSGLETRIRWELPAGARADPIEWPYPQRLPVEHLVNYGFEGETFLLARLHPPADLDPTRPFQVTAHAAWLVCEIECIPGEATLSLSLPVSLHGAATEPRHTAAFATARARLPQTVDWPAWFAMTDGRLHLAIDTGTVLPNDADPHYFPAANALVDHAQPQTVVHVDGRLELSQASSPYFTQAPDSLEGVLVWRTGEVTHAYLLAALPANVGAGASASPTVAGMGIGLALLLALAGGLLLNLMPCVFPVLSLKALGLAQSHDRHRVWHGAVYTLGVLFSFAVVAGLLLALRAAGEAIGWGFQLQSPWFVGLLAYLLFALALSLSGLAQFGTRLMGIGNGLATQGGLRGSFFTGVLATVVASPCTAPFMGTALGYAVTREPIAALAIFLALGLGMALPFLLLGFLPALGRWLPRPGPWMETFKQAMAFPLYLTVAWLLWVLGRQTGTDGMAAAGVGLVLLAFALWLWNRPAPRRKILQHAAAAIAVAGAVGLLAMPATAVHEPATVAANATDWEPFSERRLETLRADGRTVLVNMTADWCITCLANERVALDTTLVRQAMERADAAYLKGDWTRRDPAITAYLARFGRNGVPLYVIYRPDAPPEVLPQILTPALVVEALAAR